MHSFVPHPFCILSVVWVSFLSKREKINFFVWIRCNRDFIHFLSITSSSCSVLLTDPDLALHRTLEALSSSISFQSGCISNFLLQLDAPDVKLCSWFTASEEVQIFPDTTATVHQVQLMGRTCSNTHHDNIKYHCHMLTVSLNRCNVTSISMHLV